MISPAPPTSPTCWCAAACAPSRPSACPPRPLAEEVDAVVVALKSRTIPAPEAVAQSLAALAWLKAGRLPADLLQVLLDLRLDAEGQHRPRHRRADGRARRPDFTIACPAFPENGRTICRGYLFVGDVLLSESGMKDHPLTPDDRRQSRARAAGADAGARWASSATTRWPRARRRCASGSRSCSSEGVGIAIVDALAEADLALHRRGLCRPAAGDGGLRRGPRHRARASSPRRPARACRHGRGAAARGGSCRRPVGQLLGRHQRPGRALDAVAATRLPHRSAASSRRGSRSRSEALAWADARVRSEPVLIYATARRTR